MEFKSLKNIETSFRQIRLFTLVFASLCAVVTGFALWKSYSFAEAQRQKIYVLDNGKSLMLALSQDVRQNRPVEAREHVRRFHELFFTLSPDKSAIEGNIRRSLLLADKSAFNYYKDLSEKGYYNRIISGNINQMIEIDSLRCDFDKYPYSVRTFARQIILRESSVTERSLVTRCRLLDAVRSDNNPHASFSAGSRNTPLPASCSAPPAAPGGGAATHSTSPPVPCRPLSKGLTILSLGNCRRLTCSIPSSFPSFLPMR